MLVCNQNFDLWNPLQLRKGELDVALFERTSINQVFLHLSQEVLLSILLAYFVTIFSPSVYLKPF